MTGGRVGYDELRSALIGSDGADTGTPATQEEVAHAEAAIGSFPADYRAFVLEFGWASVGPHEIFGLGDGVPRHSEVVGMTRSERSDGGLPDNLIAIYNDGWCNLACLADETGPSAVVIWDHEVSRRDGPLRAAYGFSDWVLALIG